MYSFKMCPDLYLFRNNIFFYSANTLLKKIYSQPLFRFPPINKTDLKRSILIGASIFSMHRPSNETSRENDSTECAALKLNLQDKSTDKIVKNNRKRNDANPNAIIGGTNVVHSKDRHLNLQEETSLSGEDYSDASPLDSDINTSTSSESFNKTSKRPEDNVEPSPDTSHKIFTFSLPFGGKSFTPDHSLSNLVTSLLPHDTNTKNNKIANLNKEQLKEKLKRSESITSLEEMALFSDEKGIDNVRARAFKKTFEMESIKRTIKSLTASPGECTHDGYEYTRLESIWDELEGDFLLMGGYRGSILRDAETHRRLWIPLKAGFNLRKINLLIGPQDKDEEQTQKEIIPDKMLSHIGPIDISKRLMKKLRSNPKNTVDNFGYDWRLSLQISADHLKKRLQEIYDNQQEKKGTYVIAHSMGGLVAHKVLQEHTHLIRGLIYVGSPSECSNILGPLKFGDEVFMNKTILSKEVNFFMRSSFYFLPIHGTCFVNKETFKKCDIDFFDPEVWVKLGLSPLVDDVRKAQTEIKENQNDNKEACIKEKEMAQTESKKKQPQPGISTDVKELLGIFNPIPMIRSISLPNSGTVCDSNSALKSLNPASIISKFTTSATEAIGLTDNKDCDEEDDEITFQTSYEDSLRYLERTLERAKNYSASLSYIPDKEYPPLAIVYGNKVPTVRGVKINSWEDVKLGHYDDFYYGPGDGVVHHKWLLPERRGFPVDAKIASNCGHVSLLSDLESMAKAFISILDKEKQTINV